MTPVIEVGDRVWHPSHKAGRVVAIHDNINEILFDSGGARSIVATYPDLRQLGPWEEGRISPPLGELNDQTRFAPALSRGERELASMLDRCLEPEWRLYVRPHLDAERPLLAAVHPSLGGMIWDVVDWDPDAVQVRGSTWDVDTQDGQRQMRSPLDYLDEVRRKLYGVYLPEIGEHVNDDHRRFGVVRAGLYFENAETARVAHLGGSNYSVFGNDSVHLARLDRVMPPLHRSSVWQPEWFDALDAVLGRVYRLPDALSAQPIDREQDRLAMPRPGVDLIEGVAGSGKSIVLAYRAARIAQQGRRVLILTYNRTLTNYLHGVLRRVPVRRDPELITVLHFHDLLGRVFAHHRLPKPRLPDPTTGMDPHDTESRWLDDDWPERALEALEKHGVPAKLRFDAILIDEGQDFGPTYSAVLQALVASATEAEVVVAIDPAQRIYRRRSALADGGPWASIARRRPLRKGYRLAVSAAAVATQFARAWGLPGAPIDGRDDALLPGRFDWIAVANDAEAAAAVAAVLDGWSADSAFLASRVAVLVSAVSMGEGLVRLLAEHGYSTNHVFAVRGTGALLDEGMPPHGESWRISQARKTAFAFADSRVKVTTINSFKGWDADRVIFVLPPHTSHPSAELLGKIYVGLTRAREDTVVVGTGDGMGLAALALDRPSIELDPGIRDRFRELRDEPPVARRTARTVG